MLFPVCCFKKVFYGINYLKIKSLFVLFVLLKNCAPLKWAIQENPFWLIILDRRITRRSTCLCKTNCLFM